MNEDSAIQQQQNPNTMQKIYPKPSSSSSPSSNHHHENVIHELSKTMGIDIFGPQSSSEKVLAHSFGEFSHFVLHTAKEACLEILEMELHRSCSLSSVGILQGGSDSHSIYRVSFPTNTTSENDDDLGLGGKKNMKRKNSSNSNNGNVAAQLLQLYNQQCTNKSSVLTIDDIQQYMLDMISRRRRLRNRHGDRGFCEQQAPRLGNLMFIMQFGGPTLGQVRHIDNMVPNVQICLYMSHRCPSTIVYVVDDLNGFPVTDGETLIDFWERQYHHQHQQQEEDASHRYSVPTLIRQILLDNGDRRLKDAWHTHFFTQWNTINAQLECFGKLFQAVSRTLALDAVSPGTTLIAGGNDIHAGPPTIESRMFAFAIGIISEHDETGDCGTDTDRDYVHDGDGDDDDASMEAKKVNDGEVQYSPVLLHFDFCCLLFSILDYEYNASDEKDLVREAKVFLVQILTTSIRDYPTKQYLLQIDADRVGIRIWLEKVLNLVLGNDDKHLINDLMDEAVNSDKILYSPDIVKRRARKKNVRRKSEMKVNGGKKSNTLEVTLS